MLQECARRVPSPLGFIGPSGRRRLKSSGANTLCCVCAAVRAMAFACCGPCILQSKASVHVEPNASHHHRKKDQAPDTSRGPKSVEHHPSKKGHSPREV